MQQKYKIDRLHLVTYNGQAKRKVRDMQYRYLAKSQLVKCNAVGTHFSFINFRGSHFKEVNFSGATIDGCDFWGTSFNQCNFGGARISDCVFMACKFKDCNFDGAIVEYTTIVNTNLSECNGLDVGRHVEILSKYPDFTCTSELVESLASLKENLYLRKYKLLHLPGAKYNKLNLYLLQKRFSEDELPRLLLRLGEKSTKSITTYKKLERVLQKEKRMI